MDTETLFGLAIHGLDINLNTARSLQRRQHHGGWLRGVVGHALQRGNCVMETPDCGGCALREGCAYPQLFRPQMLPGHESHLPPYVIHDWRLLRDDPGIRFQVLLLGAAVNHAENLIRQLDAHAPTLDMGGGGPGRVGTVRDLGSGEVIFAAGCFRRGATLRPLSPPPVGEAVTVRLLTPLVSKHDHADPLFAPLRTRVQRLVNLYGDGTRLPFERAPWRVVASRLREVAVSQGDGSARRVRGRTGEVRLVGVNGEGGRMLAAGAFLHAGAEASLGFGRLGVGGEKR